MTFSLRRALLASIASLASLALVAGCADPDYHGPPDDELNQVHMAVTCPASMSYYPIGGPHNGGWDSNALTYTCADHPSSSPDNSDWISGDHYGNDLFAARGTPAIAVTSGTISHSGYGTVSGNRVTIRDDCGWHYFSGHLDTIAPGMTVGRRVEAGEVIGTVGNTGNASGTSPHIHFNIYGSSWTDASDPFPLLQQVDGSACTGSSSIAEGTTPDPDVNPCIDADIRADEDTSDFALASGVAELFNEIGRSEGSFLAQDTYGGGAPYTVGKWGPWVSHTGLWEVDARVPDTGLQLTSAAYYDVAFLGGHVMTPVDQNANKGEWVPITPGPLKFGVGPAGYVGLSNVLSVGTGGKVAYDSVRFRYIGPEGNTQVGGSCDLSNDCAGTLICGEFGTCEQPCSDSYCDSGACDQATGVCVDPDGDDGGTPTDSISQFGDSDRDGIPNYLEGLDDTDGDGIANWLDWDSDGDGVMDWVEGAGDADGDGILDSMDTDADGDGMLDGDEAGPDPDMPLDTDLDGIPDFRDTDSDGDGIPDAYEIGDPDDPLDSDNDGMPDYRDLDSDNDGIRDDAEAGWVPDDPADFDGDGIPNHLDLDSDGDGLSDRFEGNDDSDGDRSPDFLDLDSDNDGIPDANDPDSDGDGRDDDDLGWGDWNASDRVPLAPMNGCSTAASANATWLALLLPFVVVRRRD